MKAKAILVDGPRRGETVDLDSPYQPDFIVALPQPLQWVAEMGAENLPSFRTAHYRITRSKLFGEFLLIGSLLERPRDCDLFEALASNVAKDAKL